MPVPEPPDHDLFLVGLAERMRAYTGRIEDMSAEERLLVLGLFGGAVSRLTWVLLELDSRAGPAHHTALHAVALAAGLPEDWATETCRHCGERIRRVFQAWGRADGPRPGSLICMANTADSLHDPER